MWERASDEVLVDRRGSAEGISKRADAAHLRSLCYSARSRRCACVRTRRFVQQVSEKLYISCHRRVIEICCKNKTSKYDHHHYHQRQASAAAGAQLVVMVVVVLDLRVVVGALWYLLPGTWYGVE